MAEDLISPNNYQLPLVLSLSQRESLLVSLCRSTAQKEKKIKKLKESNFLNNVVGLRQDDNEIIKMMNLKVVGGKFQRRRQR